MTTENQINQQYDRITQILRQEAAAPVDYNQLAITNMVDPQGYAGAVQGEQDRKQQAEGNILQLFEAQKARGDKQAQALDDKINLFTGGDPEGNALILQQLHDDPESIDPGNAYQVMTKIAGIVKKNGYTSPAQQEQKLNLQLKKAQLGNATKGPAKPENIRELEAYSQLTPEQQAMYDKLNKVGGSGGGPFQGTGLDAQAANILLGGDPSTPSYAAAYAMMSEPKVLMNGSTITPDMTPYRKPATGGGSGPTITPPTIMNEAQSKDALYADRAYVSDAGINSTGDAGTSYAQRAVEAIPLVGNSLVSDDYQSFSQSQRDFINAILRRESGAVISPDEFKNARKQYFPQPGDSDKTLAQKAANRELAASGIARGAGPAYKAPSLPAGEIDFNDLPD